MDHSETDLLMIYHVLSSAFAKHVRSFTVYVILEMASVLYFWLVYIYSHIRHKKIAFNSIHCLNINPTLCHL